MRSSVGPQSVGWRWRQQLLTCWVASLIIFFAVGGPFGFINDASLTGCSVCSAGTGVALGC